VLLREDLERLLTEAGFDVVGKVGTAEELSPARWRSRARMS
jgi:hypothetical protein